MSLNKNEEGRNGIISKPRFNLEKIAKGIKYKNIIKSARNKNILDLINPKLLPNKQVNVQNLTLKKESNNKNKTHTYKLRKNKSSPNIIGFDYDNVNNKSINSQTYINQISDLRKKIENDTIFNVKFYKRSKNQQMKIYSFFNKEKESEYLKFFKPIKNIKQISEYYGLKLNDYNYIFPLKTPKTSKLGAIVNLFKKYALNNINKNHIEGNKKESQNSLFLTNDNKVKLKKNYSAINDKIIEKDCNIVLDCIKSKTIDNKKLTQILSDRNIIFPTIELFKQDPTYRRIHKIDSNLPKILNNNNSKNKKK